MASKEDDRKKDVRRQKATADDREDEEERAKGKGKKGATKKYACHKCPKSYTGHTTWLRHLVNKHQVKDVKDTPASPKTQEKYRAYDRSKAKRAEAEAKRKQRASKKEQHAKRVAGESSSSEAESDHTQSDTSDESDVEKSDEDSPIPLPMTKIPLPLFSHAAPSYWPVASAWPRPRLS